MVRNAGRRPKAAAPPGPWPTLLRVAWLAILLGLLLQLALLLVAAGFGTDISPRPLLAETLKTVSWSLLVCVGVALGRVAAKGQVPLEGVTGLLAAPLALTAANTVQKVVAEAVDAAGVPAGPAPLWVLAIKAAEYACLGLALNWVGRRAWHSARAPGGRPDDRRRLWRGVPGGGRPVGPDPAGHPRAGGPRPQ